MLRFLTAGESHGKALVAIIEGLPANMDVDVSIIDRDLKRRMSGYGRGGRMKIESDRVEILSGLFKGKTIGSPLAMLIKNLDYENWKGADVPVVTRPRPKHGDLAGVIKYRQEDIGAYLRGQAPGNGRTCCCWGYGKTAFVSFGIRLFSHVTAIGNVKVETQFRPDDSRDIMRGKNPRPMYR